MVEKAASKRLTVQDQLKYMRDNWPEFESNIKVGRLSCVGTVQPFSFTDRYAVRISYVPGRYPKVYVDKPRLKRRKAEERIPHTYSDDQPCLFYRDRYDWSSEDPIALTVVPWLLEWIVYYETWLFTGAWEGGGIHPGNPDEKDRSELRAETLFKPN